MAWFFKLWVANYGKGEGKVAPVLSHAMKANWGVEVKLHHSARWR
jgi:hypothetical protein